jgi:hypothetical protein
MLYLSIGSAIVLILIVLAWVFIASDPVKLARFLRWFIIISASGLALFLLFRGQALLAAAPAAVAAIGWRVFRLVPLGLWFRLFQMGKAFSGSRKYRPRESQSGSQGASTVDSEWMQMKLDHDTGALNGLVIKGHYSGRHLDSLEPEELDSLLLEVRDDEATVRLLENYMLRRFGGEWAERASASSASEKVETMGREEAYEILGLPADSDEEAIRRAHRKLMASNHPDRGGSSYIATKINQARDILLQS